MVIYHLARSRLVAVKGLKRHGAMPFCDLVHKFQKHFTNVSMRFCHPTVRKSDFSPYRIVDAKEL